MNIKDIERMSARSQIDELSLFTGQLLKKLGDERKMSIEDTDEIFERLNAMGIEESIGAARIILVDHQLVPNTQSKSWKEFIEKYTTAIVLDTGQFSYISET